MGAGLVVIPFVGLVIPIVLLLAALVFDALYISSVVYRLWHDRVHGRLWRVLHRPR